MGTLATIVLHVGDQEVVGVKGEGNGMELIKSKQFLLRYHRDVDEEVGVMAVEQQGGFELEQVGVVIDE